MYNAELGVGCNSNQSNCNNSNGCSGTPDLCIKRHDGKPHFKVSVSDCDGVVDLTDENLVLEASMWFDAKLKADILVSGTSLSFADNVGFNSVLVGDVISTSRPRSPERMLVTSINESAKSVTVQRGYDGTSAYAWSKGEPLKIFRFRDAPAEIESVFEETTSLDGTTTTGLADTFLVFKWSGNHTSLPGCYWLEFKLIMMSGGSVEWTKRFPLASDGFLISVIDSPTSEI
jgi:hypothetical protein